MAASSGSDAAKALFIVSVGGMLIYAGYKLFKPIGDLLDTVGDVLSSATDLGKSIVKPVTQIPGLAASVFTIWFADCSWKPSGVWLDMAVDPGPVRPSLLFGGSFGTGVPRGLTAAIATWGVTAAAANWGLRQTLSSARVDDADQEMREALQRVVNYSSGSFSSAAQRIYHSVGVTYNCGKIPPGPAQYASNIANEIITDRFKRLFGVSVVLKPIGQAS